MPRLLVQMCQVPQTCRVSDRVPAPSPALPHCPGSRRDLTSRQVAERCGGQPAACPVDRAARRSRGGRLPGLRQVEVRHRVAIRPGCAAADAMNPPKKRPAVGWPDREAEVQFLLAVLQGPLPPGDAVLAAGRKRVRPARRDGSHEVILVSTLPHIKTVQLIL
jgi:hypothetical protein